MMGIIFVLGLFSFLTGLAGIGADGNGFSVAGVILGACTMVVSLLSMAWPPPPRRDTTKILTSLRSALPGMVKTAMAGENGPVWHCGHDGRCCQCGLPLSRSRPKRDCRPNGKTNRENLAKRYKNL